MFLSVGVRTCLRVTFSTKRSKTLVFVSIVNQATAHKSFDRNIEKCNKCKKLKVSIFICWYVCHYQIGIYMFIANNENTRTICEICLKLTIKTPERCQRQLFPLFTLNK